MSRALDLAQSAGAQYADIRVVENRTESIQVKNGVVESIHFSDSIGFGIRVLVNGAWGFSSSRELTAEEIDRVSKQALEIARNHRIVWRNLKTWHEMEGYAEEYTSFRRALNN